MIININPANDGQDKTKEIRRIIREGVKEANGEPLKINFLHTHPAICNGMVREHFKTIDVKVSDLRKEDERNYFYDFELPEIEEGYRYYFVPKSNVKNGGITFNEGNFRYLKDHDKPFKDESIVYEVYITEDHEWADTGEYGIFRFEGIKNVQINFLSGVMQFRTNVDTELYGNAIGRNHHDTARRSFWHFVDCENIEAHNINAQANNNKPNAKGGREDFPIFSKFREFEHFIRFESCKKMYFTNIWGKDLWGDGIYTDDGCEDITVIKGLIDRNGRQTIAPCGGKRLWFEGIEGTASTRGYCDVEVPNYSRLGIVEDLVVINGKGKTWLNVFPMGGSGDINRVLFEDIELDSKSRTSYINGEGRRKRDNITFRRIIRTRSHGSDKSINAWYDAHNIMLEDCYTLVSADRSQQVVELHGGSKNIIIKGDTGENIKFIELNDGIGPSEVKVYQNNQDLYLIDSKGNLIQEEPIKDSTLEEIEASRPEEPNFEPYMGFVETKPTPEPEEPTDPREEPVENPELPKPDKPIESEEEALDMAQKILDFLKKKSTKIGLIVLVIIILIGIISTL